MKATYYERNKERVKANTRRRAEIERFGAVGVREEVIKRDGERCVECGLTRREHRIRYGTDITVNHIDGTGRNTLPTNNDPSNLETLCLSCHGRKDVRRADFTKRNTNPQWREAVSRTWFQKGRQVSEAEREKLRQRMLADNPFKGKKHSEAARRIMSQKAKQRLSRKQEQYA